MKHSRDTLRALLAIALLLSVCISCSSPREAEDDGESEDESVEVERTEGNVLKEYIHVPKDRAHDVKRKVEGAQDAARRELSEATDE